MPRSARGDGSGGQLFEFGVGAINFESHSGANLDADDGLGRLGGEGQKQLAAVQSVYAVTWARRLATPAV